ncbi:MAG: SgcJ/EcaC family oxidoreductase [Thiohalomonadaceae bacterium]
MSPETPQPQSQQPEDEAAVRALYLRLMDGWNNGDAEAFAGPFTEDAHLVAFDGTHFKGRKEIVSFHQPLFDKWLKGTRLVGEVESVRFLGPGVALMHARGGTIMRGKSQPAPEWESIQTLVVVKREGEWRLVAFQNTRVRPMGRSTRSIVIWLFTGWLWKVVGLKR